MCDEDDASADTNLLRRQNICNETERDSLPSQMENLAQIPVVANQQAHGAPPPPPPPPPPPQPIPPRPKLWRFPEAEFGAKGVRR